MNKQNTFLVKYANGKELTETLDATDFPDVETYCQKRYGLDAKATEDYGTVVKQVDQTKPAEVAAEAKAKK